jgi:hypothetical protein
MILFNRYFANDNDPYIPEIWAMESLAILEENMIASGLVYRDFENQIASFGDTVNTRRPNEFSAKRKTDADDVTIQDATATNVAVKLNQHIHTSFMIKDGEQSKSMKDLFDEYLNPAMLAQARILDQILLGQYAQFLPYALGGLGSLSTSNSVDRILANRNQLNVNKAPVSNRNMILTPNTETAFLGNTNFLTADKMGDGGRALREASLGRKLGFDMYMCQNMSSILATYTLVSGAINLTAGYAKGTTGALVVDGFSTALTNGRWLSVDGVPYQLVSHTETLGNTTGITLDRALNQAVANDAVVKQYPAGAVNNASGYAADYSKEITIDGLTEAPQVGQMVTFGTTGVTTRAIYTIIQVNGLVGITLDRPLEAALADDAVVNLGPSGEYNFSYLKNSMALVVRPLALPPTGAGARAAVVNNRNLSMRATVTYQGIKQGTLVTLDFLCGIKILDQKQGTVLLG